MYMSNVPSNAVLLMYLMFYRSRYSDYIYQSTERPFCVPTLCELGDVFCVRPRTIHCMRKASRHEFIEEHETISGFHMVWDRLICTIHNSILYECRLIRVARRPSDAQDGSISFVLSVKTIDGTDLYFIVSNKYVCIRHGNFPFKKTTFSCLMHGFVNRR